MTVEYLCPSLPPVSIVVIEMKKIKWEKKVSLAGKLLRLIEPRSSIQGALGLQEKNVNTGFLRNSYYDNRKGINAAMLEAERKKAKALMALERYSFI